MLRGERKAIQGPARRSVVAAAYAVSLLAGVLHAQAALTGAPVPSGLAMRLLTYTFVALVVPLAALTRRQPASRRAVWAAALAAFAVSALHPEPAAPGGCLVARGIAGPSHVGPAGLRHPLPGLSVRPRRPVSETRPDAGDARGDRVAGHRHVRRAVTGLRSVPPGRSAAGGGPGDDVGRQHTGVSRAAARDLVVRGQRDSSQAGLPVASSDRRPAGPGARRHSGPVDRHVRVADAGDERPRGDVARMVNPPRRGHRVLGGRGRRSRRWPAEGVGPPRS